MAAGTHTVDVDARAAGMSNGICFYRIDTESGQKSGKIVIANP